MKNEETKNMGHDVFISYATAKADSTGSRDCHTADTVYTALETHGIRCWAAHRDISPGDNWRKSIVNAVEKSKVLVLVFSSNTNISKWAKVEVALALDENIRIIPFRIDDVSPLDELKILKVSCQWLDAFTPPMEEHIGNLVDVISRHLGKEPPIFPPITEGTGENEKPDPIEPVESVKENRHKPEKMPEEVQSVRSKGIEVYKTDKGCWEADYGDSIKMVYIPAGEFTMGSNDYEDDEKPVHTVHLDGYWLGKTEVTEGQFRLFTEDKRYATEAERNGGAYTWTGEKWEMKKDINWKNPGYKQDDNHPVVCVSWNDVVEYCKWLSTKKGFTFKLPTEAQWEKAARGAGSRKYPWGDNDPDEKLANFGLQFDKTSPVGSYPVGASPYGLLDMAGNVWEWCNDWYDSDYYKKSPRQNPPGPDSGGSLRVLRGGSWNYNAVNLRFAIRFNVRPSIRFVNAGFRLAQDN